MLVTDPKFIKMALAQTERGFYKGRIYDLAKVLVGDGIVTSKGAQWKKNRTLINPIFAAENLQTFDFNPRGFVDHCKKIKSQQGNLINLSQLSSS